MDKTQNLSCVCVCACVCVGLCGCSDTCVRGSHLHTVCATNSNKAIKTML